MNFYHNIYYPTSPNFNEDTFTKLPEHIDNKMLVNTDYTCSKKPDLLTKVADFLKRVLSLGLWKPKDHDLTHIFHSINHDVNTILQNCLYQYSKDYEANIDEKIAAVDKILAELADENTIPKYNTDYGITESKEELIVLSKEESIVFIQRAKNEFQNYITNFKPKHLECIDRIIFDLKKDDYSLQNCSFKLINGKVHLCFEIHSPRFQNTTYKNGAIYTIPVSNQFTETKTPKFQNKKEMIDYYTEQKKNLESKKNEQENIETSFNELKQKLHDQVEPVLDKIITKQKNVQVRDRLANIEDNMFQKLKPDHDDFCRRVSHLTTQVSGPMFKKLKEVETQLNGGILMRDYTSRGGLFLQKRAVSSPFDLNS